MNIQIGTAYASACDVNWTNILVDASYFLKAKNNILERIDAFQNSPSFGLTWGLDPSSAGRCEEEQGICPRSV